MYLPVASAIVWGDIREGRGAGEGGGSRIKLDGVQDMSWTPRLTTFLSSVKLSPLSLIRGDSP